MTLDIAFVVLGAVLVLGAPFYRARGGSPYYAAQGLAVGAVALIVGIAFLLGGQ